MIEIMRLSDATDLDLLEAGIVSVRELTEDGPVLSGWCWDWDGGHDWSTPQAMPGDQNYRICRTCGAIHGTDDPVRTATQRIADKYIDPINL